MRLDRDRSLEEIASELDRLWAEQGRRAGNICELLDDLARGSADGAELRLVANQLLGDVRHSAQAAPAPTLKLVDLDAVAGPPSFG
jgi:hypothetical protein